MKDTDVSHEDKRNMMEMLQRLEENLAGDGDDEDEDDERRQSLAERLEGLDLDADTEVVWERLTEEEKAEFAQILKSENLGLLVPSWQPWWTFHDRELVKMVEKEGFSPTDMSSSSGLDHTQTSCPKAISSIPKLTDLLRNKEPSPLIVYDVINVLFSYTFLMRFYNGEVKDFTEEMAQQLLQISEALSKNRNFRTLQEAVQSVLERVTKVLKEASSNRIICLQDTTHILLGRSPSKPLEYIMGALSDCWRLMSSAKKSLAKDSSSKPLQKNLFSCKKKLEFYLAWVTEFPDTFRIVAVEVQSVYKSALEEQTVQDKVKSSLDKRKPGTTSSKLIEEIS